MSPLMDTIRELRKLLAKLERFASTKPLDQAICEVLEDAGAMSTSAVAALLRKRRADVLSTLKLLAAAGRVRRTGDDTRWEVVDGQ